MAVVRAADLAYASLPGRRSADPLPPGFDPGVSVRVVRVPPGARAPHRHPRSVEVMVVLAGSGTTWEDEVSAPVGPGDLVLVPVGAPHVTVADGPDELVLACFFPAGDLPANTEELAGPVRG